MLSKLGQLPRAAAVVHLRRRRMACTAVDRDFTEDVAHTSLVLETEARRFIHDCLRRVGVPFEKLRGISDLLLAADYRGVYGSGLNRLEMYLAALQQGNVDIKAEPEIISETETLAHVDGNCAMGVFVGNYCMDLAVEKARKSGIGFVLAKRSSHIGMASWYAFRAMASGCIGLVLSNAAPMMIAPGAQDATIGANCLAFGADGIHSHFMLDMATSVKEIGSVELAYLRDEHIPEGWAADDCGQITIMPNLALRAQRLFPAGGTKGFALAAMIDILCGVMSGANYATRIPPMWSESQGCSPNLGLAMLAIDPSAFVPNFGERLDDFKNCIDSNSLSSSICLAGEPEKMHMHFVNDLGALPIPNALLTKYKSIANLLCVPPMQLAFTSRKSKYRCT